MPANAAVLLWTFHLKRMCLYVSRWRSHFQFNSPFENGIQLLSYYMFVILPLIGNICLFLKADFGFFWNFVNDTTSCACLQGRLLNHKIGFSNWSYSLVMFMDSYEKFGLSYVESITCCECHCFIVLEFWAKFCFLWNVMNFLFWKEFPSMREQYVKSSQLWENYNFLNI